MKTNIYVYLKNKHINCYYMLKAAVIGTVTL